MLLLLCDRLSEEGCHPTPPLLPHLPGLAGHRSMRGLSIRFSVALFSSHWKWPLPRRSPHTFALHLCPYRSVMPRCVPATRPERHLCPSSPLWADERLCRNPNLHCYCPSWGHCGRQTASVASVSVLPSSTLPCSVSCTHLRMSRCADLSHVFVY